MDRAVCRSPVAGQAFPDRTVETPCFVVHEDAVLRNLRRAIAASGSADRLVPHVKTHRADWIVRLALSEGIRAFKCATPAEVEMVLEARAPNIIWAYPSANTANIARVLAAAQRHPDARVTGLVDSEGGFAAWKTCLSERHANVDLRVDLDLGMERTGVPPGERAERQAHRGRSGRWWKLYVQPLAV